MGRTNIFVIIFLLQVFAANAQSINGSLKPGFDPKESYDLLALNKVFDSVPAPWFDEVAENYRFAYRSPEIGLDNSWDLWLRQDSTAVLMLRATTSDPKSILADFLCAMSPAQGKVVIAAGDTVAYKLAEHPKAAVHTGFLIGFAYLAKDIRPKVDSLYAKGYRNFIVAGHSQGGALCYFVSSWLHYLEKDGNLPGLTVKTYASASPKTGNMYFAYNYDNIMRGGWAFSLVNSEDPVPDMPLTTQQVEEVNSPNPLTLLLDRSKEMPFLKRVVLKRAVNRMQKSASKSSKMYQRYLGSYTADIVRGMMPGLEIPNVVNTTYFVRPGIPISLVAGEGFLSRFGAEIAAHRYSQHNPETYQYLLRYYYEGF